MGAGEAGWPAGYAVSALTAVPPVTKTLSTTAVAVAGMFAQAGFSANEIAVLRNEGVLG